MITLVKVIDGARIRATIDVEIKTARGERQTVDHRVVMQYKEISISGSITGGNFGSHGQCLDQINEVFGDNSHVATIHRIWSRYHLNGVKAGCIHQKTGKYDDKEIISQVCETGYKYGSAWLVEIVPDSVITELQAAVDGLKSLGYQRTHYEEFAHQHNIKIERVVMIDVTDKHREYHIKLSRGGKHGGKHLIIPSFRMGLGLKQEPGLNDVLGCLVSDSRLPDEFEEFCSDLGYDQDSREAEKIFKAVQSQTKKVKAFLGEGFDEFQQLEES